MSEYSKLPQLNISAQLAHIFITHRYAKLPNCGGESIIAGQRGYSISRRLPEGLCHHAMAAFPNGGAISINVMK